MTREDAKALISKMQATPISSGDVGDSLAERILCNLEGGGMHFTQGQPIATPVEQAPYEPEPTPKVLLDLSSPEQP